MYFQSYVMVAIGVLCVASGFGWGAVGNAAACIAFFGFAVGYFALANLFGP